MVLCVYYNGLYYEERLDVVEQSSFCWRYLRSHAKVYQIQSSIEDVELCERIKAAWEELDQRIIDTALQSGSGALALMDVSRQKATTLSTSCLD